MKEQDLIDLGFDKIVETEGGGEDFHYYTLDIGNDYVPLCLIPNANDEAKEND